ncbi:MAG: hypothetical protein ACFE0P_09305 [Oceanicaulis sp.]
MASRMSACHAALMAALALAACGAPGETVAPTPPDERTSPYAPDGERCNDELARGEIDDLIQAGDTSAMRCFLSLRDVEPDSFNLRYLIYRIEGVEPEGLDDLVRERDRLELGARLSNLHAMHPSLEPFEFRGGCKRYDAVARELLSRTPPQDEVKGCRRWGL